MEELLKQLLAGFAENPQAGERSLREMLASDGKPFCAASLSLIKSGADTPGQEFLVALLAERDLLFGPLCDPSFCSRTQAIALAKIAARTQPQLDVKLARRLPDLDAASCERVLAILAQVSDGSRIVFMLMPLMRQANVRLRSKAALLIGRTLKRTEWVSSYLNDADPRTRANAVAALWGVAAPEARAVLQRATRDAHSRVAVNALLGLYKLGDTGAISQLVEISASADPKVRASAAWGMGETGDPRFLPILARMDPHPSDAVGRNISRAVERIQLASSAAAERGRLSICVADAQSLPDGTRRLQSAITAPDRWDPLGLLPTHFVIWEDSRIVSSYRVQASDPNAALAVGFALCAGAGFSQDDLQAARDSILQCLEHKRPADCWAVSWQGQVSQFSGDKAVLKKVLNGSAPPARAAGPANVFAQLIDRASRTRGSRHLIALAGPQGLPAGDSDSVDIDRIAQSGIQTKTAVHVVGVGSFAPQNEIEALCRKTGGSFVSTTTRQGIPDLYRQIYASLLNRYEILYRVEAAPAAPAESAGRIRLEIYSDYGHAETEAALTG